MQGRPEKNLNLIASPEDLQSKDKLPDWPTKLWKRSCHMCHKSLIFVVLCYITKTD
jgi:hypothetical protein